MIETNDKYSWDTEKRKLNIKKRGLDFVVLADFIFNDPDVVIEPDSRKNYDEERYWAFALVGESHLCLCFTLREKKIHLITIFQMHEKRWRKHYEKKD